MKNKDYSSSFLCYKYVYYLLRETESEDHSQNPQALPCDSDKANMSATGFKVKELFSVVSLLETF